MTADRACSIWTTVRNLRIHAYSAVPAAATSPTVVLVHGLGVSARYMCPLLEALSQDYKVFAPEMPGFGRSDTPNQVFDIPELADVLAEWLEALGLQHAVLLGNSMGCQVILDLAMRYPQRIHAIVLVGPTIDSAARTILRQLCRGIRDLLREPWSLWPILARDYMRSGPIRTLQTLRFALRDRVEAKCEFISAPALVVRGSCDPIATQHWVEELARLMPAGRATTIAGGTHAVNYSVPAALAREVRDFLGNQPA